MLEIASFMLKNAFFPVPLRDYLPPTTLSLDPTVLFPKISSPDIGILKENYMYELEKSYAEAA